ncbi:hypothetical protein [Clostridium sp. C2-6-12]|nr:hypothetical protein [Clostridium sp. C2-6-12]
MNEDFQKFIISCVQLGKEIIDKENLTEKEEDFIKNLDVMTDKYLG